MILALGVPGFCSIPGAVSGRDETPEPAKNLAIMTYLLNAEQVRSVKALITSVRDLAGPYRGSRVFVVLADPDKAVGKALEGPNVELLDLDMEPAFRDYPLAVKAFAAAQVEKVAGKDAATLVWLDPGVLVLGSLAALDLEGKFDAALRPVTLSNAIGLPPGVEPNDYWKPIYEANSLDYRQLPVLETIADQVRIQPYYNCEVYSVTPKAGLCGAWADILTRLLKDEDYQRSSCSTFPRKLFLHQAVLSGVVSARVRAPRIKPLPLTSGYPFNQHPKLPASSRVSALNDLAVVIFDDAWGRNPAWMDSIPIREPLRGWLVRSTTEYLKLDEHLYRVEGSCNSYLVTTGDGSVLIDPAGASVAPEFYAGVLEKFPLRAVLLTHAHRDHSDDAGRWAGSGNTVPVIAQREYPRYFDYCRDLAGFFARRNAIWAGRDVPTGSPVQEQPPTNPTVFFADKYCFELGGLHIQMTHTPGETPDQTTIWIPELKAVFVGDNYDGLNEHGLAVAVAGVGQVTLKPRPGKEKVFDPYLIRLVLDRTGTVEEAVTIAQKYIPFALDENSLNAHFYVSDASGRSAILEYSGEEWRVIPGEKPWQVLTNKPVAGVADAMLRQKCWRFKSISETLEKRAGELDWRTGLRILRDVTQKGTTWSVVYSPTTLDLHFSVYQTWDVIYHLPPIESK
jgi:glyoxylase-like metal-dependent hydrolase (beta-lactamase superfamily II)